MLFSVLVAVKTIAGIPINQQFSTREPITESNDVIDQESDEVNFEIHLHRLCRIDKLLSKKIIQLTEEQNAKTQFSYIDIDGDGKISKEELRTDIGQVIPEAQLQG